MHSANRRWSQQTSPAINTSLLITVVTSITGAACTSSAAASVEHGAGSNLSAELAQAKRREAEASTRVAALEAKLKSSSSVHGEMQASVQELSHRLQVSRLPSKCLLLMSAQILMGDSASSLINLQERTSMSYSTTDAQKLYAHMCLITCLVAAFQT